MGRRLLRSTTAAALTAGLVATLTVGVAAPAAAATLTVTRTDDPTPDGCSSGADCSLREAVLAAVDGDEIVLSAGTYRLTRAGDDDLGMVGDLDVDVDLTIRGDGSGPVVIDASGLGASQQWDRVLHLVVDGIDVTLDGVTLTGGLADGSSGGAILVSGDDVALDVVGSVLHSNIAAYESGFVNCCNPVPLSVGGGIGIEGERADVDVVDSELRGNTAEFGGAIGLAETAVDATVRITSSTLGSATSTANPPGVAVGDHGTGRFQTPDANRADHSGGALAILADGVTVSVTGSDLTGNTASWSCCFDTNESARATATTGAGGAIYAFGADDIRHYAGFGNADVPVVGLSLTITDSAVSENKADTLGGGIYLSASDPATSTLTITGSDLSGNKADYDGGAIFTSGVAVAVDEARVTGNTTDLGDLRNSTQARDAGGIGVLDGELTIERTTLADNRTGRHGGALYLAGTTTTGTLENVTLSGNAVQRPSGNVGRGGAVYTDGADVALTHATVSHNRAPTGQAAALHVEDDGNADVTLDRSILANSNTMHCNVPVDDAVGGNLADDLDDSCFTDADTGTVTVGGNDVVADVALAPLADNGGPAVGGIAVVPRTHELLATSPAIDHVDPGTCPPPTVDQRGLPRPVGSSCDSGALETQTLGGIPADDGDPDLDVTRFDDPEPDGCAVGDCSLREAVIAANDAAGPDTIDLTAAGAGTFTLTRVGADDTAELGDLDVTDDVTITGLGAGLTTVDAGGLDPDRGEDGNGDRALHVVDAGLTLALQDLTIRHGDPADAGGAVLISSGSTTLTTTDVDLRDNLSDTVGGGVAIDADGVTVTVIRGTWSGNGAEGSGGALATTATADAVTITIDGTVLGSAVSTAEPPGVVDGDWGSGRYQTPDANRASDFGSTGGALALTGTNGEVTIQNARLTGNKSDGHGGAIAVTGAGTTVAVVGSVISGNKADGQGGAVYVTGDGVDPDPALTVTDSVVDGNRADNAGAAFFITNERAVLDTVRIDGSLGDARGGGLYVGTATVTVRDSSITDNDVSNHGGGIYLDVTSQLTVENTTISGNSGSRGGGLYVNGGAADLVYTTVSSNSTHDTSVGGAAVFTATGTVTLLGSLLANGNVDLCNDPAAVTALGSNIADDASCYADEGGDPGDDHVVVDAGLTPLGDHGGPVLPDGLRTLTHELLGGSPAIDHATDGCGTTITTDQRGMTRPFGARCDSGAVELQAPPALPLDDGDGDFDVTRFDDPTPDGCQPGDCSLREAIIAANAAAGGIVDLANAGPGTFALTRIGDDDTADRGDLDLTAPVTVMGLGAASTIVDADGLGLEDQGGVGDRAFDVRPGATTVLLSGLGVRNGDTNDTGGGLRVDADAVAVTLQDVTVHNNNAESGGGGVGIHGAGATLTVLDSTFTGNNTEDDGGAIAVFDGADGAVLHVVRSVLGTVADSAARPNLMAEGTWGSGRFQVHDANRAEGHGGGIAILDDDVTLTVEDSTLSANKASGENCCPGLRGGGAIYGFHVTAGRPLANVTVDLDRVQLVGNKTDRQGGAIALGTDGAITITDSTISRNRADTDGGGVYVVDAALTLERVLLHDNETDDDGADGGGLFNDGGTVTILRSELSQNRANDDGGAIYNATEVSSQAPVLTILNSTLSGNAAGADGTNEGGGAIWHDKDGSLTARFTTFALNRTSAASGATITAGDGAVGPVGSIVLEASIVGDGNVAHCNLPITPAGANIADDGSCFTDEGSDPGDDRVVGSTELQPLAANAGVVLPSGDVLRTHAITQSSPAFDHTDCLGVTQDQRGVARPQFDVCDSGAFELQETSTPFIPPPAGGDPPATDDGMTETVSADFAGEGGTLTTDLSGDGATPTDPIETTVRVPGGIDGEVVIDESAPEGGVDGDFDVLGVAVDLTFPTPATLDDPYVVEFRIDPSVVPDIAGAEDLHVFRNGVLVPDCTGDGARPDPCVESRSTVDGDFVIVVRTTEASIWTFAIPAVACPEVLVPPSGFVDVDPGNVHQQRIACLLWWGITQGVTADAYGPAQAITRGQMASFLARAIDRVELGQPLPASAPDAFTDDDTNTHEASIDRLAAAGIVRGVTDDTYEPDAPVRRDQMASFLVRAYEYVTQTSVPAGGDAFSDDEGNTHEENIDKAASLGITLGTGAGTYAPAELVRRDQMASFVMRTMDLFVALRLTLPPAP